MEKEEEHLVKKRVESAGHRTARYYVRENCLNGNIDVC